MKALLLLLILGCQAKPAPVAAAPKPSASAAPDSFEAVNHRKYEAIQHCEAGGGIVAMGFGFTVICIEGQVREYNPETEKVKASSTYDYTR